MSFTFSQALEAIAKGCSSAVKEIKERVLPTPGKRKREEEAVERDRDKVDRKKRISNSMREDKKVELHRKASVNPPSQYARAAAPPLTQEAEPRFSTGQHSEQTSTALKHPVGQNAASKHCATGPMVYQTPTPMHPGRLADGYKTMNRRGKAAKEAATPDPWQRRYPVWDRQRPAYSSLLEVRPQMQFTPFAKRAQAELFSWHPGSALWGMFNGAALGEEPDCRTTQNTEHLEEKEMLRQMTTVAMQRAAGMKANHRRPGMLGHLSENREETLEVRKGIDTENWPAWLPSRAASAHILDLSAARYELEQARERRRSEFVREETRLLLLRCKELMGDKQRKLMARASVALGEAPSSHSAAAEISKASMNAAKKEAEGLKNMLSEVEFLEHQQNKLEHLREAQKAREMAVSTAKQQQEAQSELHRLPSTARGVKKPKTQPVQAAESDVVDLVSSDEEGQEEADTQHDDAASEVLEIGSSSEDGAGSQQETTFFKDKELDSDEEAEEIRVKLENIGVHEKKHPPQFRPLTAKQRALYANAMDPRSNQTKEIRFIKSRNIGLTRQLLACLRPRAWLNDEVVNGFLGLLQERDTIWRGKDDIPQCHFFTTFFFNKLYLDKQEYDYGSVARWTKPQKLKTSHQASDSILDCARVIAPVHLAVHWTCAMADLQRKEFVYLDSMGGAEPGIMHSFRRYIADEYRNKKQQTVDTSSWPIRYLEDVPQQRNGCDCGVFALIFAEHLSRNAALDFQQEDMPYFRVMITAALMQLQAPREFY